MGMIYKRGNVFWIKYYVNGRPVRESTRTDMLKAAERFLKDREGRAVMGAPALPRNERILFREAADALTEHYQVTGSRQLKDAASKMKPVKAFFGQYRLQAVDQANITRYVHQRQTEEVSNATINRELSVLGKALRLAHERGQLLRMPRIHLLQESAPRSGFFERADFERVCRALKKRPDLQAAVTIAYTYGWRMQSEVLQLDLGHVDLNAGTLRLDPGMTKNGEGRVVYLTPAVAGVLAEQVERVKALSRKLDRVIIPLFPNPRQGRWQGNRLRDFRKAWTTACAKVGLIGMIRHDFRRSAVRNLVRSGVPETVAMKITGHKTRSVFDRYNIVNDGDLREAAKKLHGHNLGTVPSSQVDTPRVSTLNSSHAPVAQLDRAAVS
ncbi:putative Phage integrase [Nitrospira sp. KM1]|uniref:tyrosine-type recombinase/integrase n=1 Tax=Nitrospira sp. KM1 TaxID=1936990 RepID=UPI0013A78164|nr:putative Phage integrase [Nitrospira sp. KM1]